MIRGVPSGNGAGKPARRSMSYVDAACRFAGDSLQTEPDLKPLLEAQRIAFAQSRDRIGALRDLERALLKRQDDIVGAISQDFGGRAAEETLALDLFPLLSEIRYACRH